MIDSYLTAGLTRGLSLALSPQTALHGEGRPAPREASEPPRRTKAPLMARLARFMTLARAEPLPSCPDTTKAASLHG